jgi:erythronate-4-phosphate dehydrogenase
LRILCDIDVPCAAEALARHGEVRLLPGRAIDHAACLGADVLIVRSVTRVDAALLEATPVRFVGTATAGTDHIDRAYLDTRAIAFASAPGSNAESVVEWVLAALLVLATECGDALFGRTLGVVGCGHVGGRLLPRAQALGLRVLACDPPLAEAAVARGQSHAFVPYAQVLADADILTFHVPLAIDGAHPTLHLLDRTALRTLKPGAWVLNASRGAVIDEPALLEALESGHIAAAALDVWNGEPTPDIALARRARIATPHIAGYGYDSKLQGARMMETALRDWLARFGRPLPRPFDWDAAAPAPHVLEAPLLPGDDTPAAHAAWLDQLVRSAYDLRADDARFRTALVDDPLASRDARADAFTALRRTYPRRRGWAHFEVSGTLPAGLRTAVTKGLGMHSHDEFFVGAT